MDIVQCNITQTHKGDFFIGHGDNPMIRTLNWAHEDARIVFKKYNATP